MQKLWNITLRKQNGLTPILKLICRKAPSLLVDVAPIKFKIKSTCTNIPVLNSSASHYLMDFITLLSSADPWLIA